MPDAATARVVCEMARNAVVAARGRLASTLGAVVGARLAMSRPLALDLFCGGGGASMGLHRAGFDVMGVDIKRQPRYPFRFVQADALNPPFDLRKFALVWASPVCKKFTSAGHYARAGGKEYPDQIESTRRLLSDSASCWAIENVPQAPIRRDYMLDGSMFSGLKVVRSRAFEVSWQPALFSHPQSRLRPGAVSYGGWSCICGNPGRKSKLPRATAAWNTTAAWRLAMGIDWMTGNELSQAIPPAYAQFIAEAALTHIRAERLAA